MEVCAQHKISRYSYSGSSCVTVQSDSNDRYRLPPGGQVTVHFNQLVVANTIRIRKRGFLTLCEVDVLGTEVVLDPEGQFTGLLNGRLRFHISHNLVIIVKY